LNDININDKLNENYEDIDGIKENNLNKTDNYKDFDNINISELMNLSEEQLKQYDKINLLNKIRLKYLKYPSSLSEEEYHLLKILETSSSNDNTINNIDIYKRLTKQKEDINYINIEDQTNYKLLECNYDNRRFKELQLLDKLRQKQNIGQTLNK
jgi:hypothetical protein